VPAKPAKRSIVIVIGMGLLGSLLVTNAARAADSDVERARALFVEAGELERQGQWSAAEDRLRTALRLKETPHLRYALAWALENDDKLIEARAEYEAAARQARERPGSEEVTRLAGARLIDLEKKMPVIRVRVGGAGKANAHVIIDGREVRSDDDVASTAVNPGSHVVRVERGPDGAVEQIAYVGRSTVRTIDVDAQEGVTERDTAQERHGRLPSRAALVGRPAPGTTEGDNVVPWFLVSGGVLAVAGGAAPLLSANADPGASTTKEAVGFALGGVGLVAGTIGTILLLKGLPPRSDRPVARIHAGAAPTSGGIVAAAALAF
jgi:hypothetical protein